MKLCIPTLCNYDGVDVLIRSAEAGRIKPDHYVIIDNGGQYAPGRLEAIFGEYSGRWTLITPGKNLGVAASWNLFLGRYGSEPIVISNDDIILGETAFAELTALAEQVPHAGYGWALFMQRPDCTERVGYYDENFWPAYYEDIDYIIRMRKAWIPERRLEGKIAIAHGAWTTVNQLGDPPWLADGREQNRSYLVAKWGTDEQGVPYAEPFNGRPPAGWDLRKRLPALPLRWDLINEIARRIGAKRYLELGLADGSCIRRIEVAHRTGVDMAPPPNVGDAVAFQCTTDEFFETTDQHWDLVFVDADHAYEQAYRDVQNAISHLNPGGVVVMHDCSPFSEDMQVVPHNGSYLWTGDVWKAVVRLRWEGQHAVRVVDSNYGLGIVIPGGTPQHFTSRPRKPEIVTYPDVVRDRENLLGLVSGWEWEEWFDKAYEPVKQREAAEYISDGLARGRGIMAADASREPAALSPESRVMLDRGIQSAKESGSVYRGSFAERDELVVIFTTLPRVDTTGTHLLKAFEELGVPVRHYEPYVRREAGIAERRGAGYLDLSRARAILCIDDDHGWTVPAAEAEHHDLPLYYWCIDSYRMDDLLYLGGTRRARLEEFDKTFFVQQKEAREFGGPWLPLAVDRALYRYEPVEKLYDWCFIGNPNTARTAFLERLAAAYPRSFVGNAYGEDANRIYNQSSIAINHSAGADINMRMFEGSATSALLLANRIDNGEDKLLPYVPLFTSFDECVELMRFYLKWPMTRALMAHQQNLMTGGHTYVERAITFLRAIDWEI